MLSNIFKSLQNKEFYDDRNYPVELTEITYINELNENSRKIKLSERVYSFDYIIFYKYQRNNPNTSIKIIGLDKFILYNKIVDATVICSESNTTENKQTFTLEIRPGVREPIVSSITVNNNLNVTVTFDTIIGIFTFNLNNFNKGDIATFTFLTLDNQIIIFDSITTFVKSNALNLVWFNFNNNSIIINELPTPFDSGNFYVLCCYKGLGSIIRASDLNDILRVIKYYNLLPKFDVTKNSINDIRLFVRGEYYFLDNFIEKIEDQEMEISDSILIGFYNAIVGYFDKAQNIFGIRRIANSLSYNNLISDITNYTFTSSEFEIPIFIIIFDPNKNPMEQAYINTNFSSILGGSNQLGSIYKIKFDVTNLVEANINLPKEDIPHVAVYDTNNYLIIPNDVIFNQSSVKILFNEPFTGRISIII